MTPSVAVAAACVMALAACTAVQQRYAPDEGRTYALNCSGTDRDWDMCYTAAGEACGAAGYDDLDRSSGDVVLAAGGSAVKTNERTMLIACKVK